MDNANPIRNVSDTALWVAIYRATESERRDAIFNDPYARRLGGARGEAIVRSMPSSEYSAWPIIVRTGVMDHIVRRCVRAGAKTVLNLAAGLAERGARFLEAGRLVEIGAAAGLAIDRVEEVHGDPPGILAFRAVKR